MNKKYALLVFLVIISYLLMTLALDKKPIYTVYAQSSTDYYFPFFLNSNQPLTSNSYYLITVDEKFYYDLGCEHGIQDQNAIGVQNSVSVLDFSYPTCDPGFGAALFAYGPASLSDIKKAVKYFAKGYYACTGSDTQSNLVIGVGTNNKPTSCDNEEKAASHGAAWAEMINHINQWLVDEGIFHQVQAYGASDIEVSWNTQEWSRAWVDGYNQVNQYPLLFFGDAAGCPYQEGSTSTSCGNGWNMDDVWFISWGSDASLPLPLIYRTDGIQAKQWANLSRYSVSQHGVPIIFTGVFTQSQACQQGTCDGTDNEPYQAYRQLTSELNKSPDTAMILNWKTDIRWILSNELTNVKTSIDADQSKLDGGSNHDIIEHLQIALNSTGISSWMQTSLEEKLNLFNLITLQKEYSRLHPAVKNP